MLFKAHPFTMMLKRSATRFPHRQTAIPNIRKSPTNLNHITSVKLEERRLSFPTAACVLFFIHSVRANRGHRGSHPCQAGFAQSNPLLVRPIPLCSLTAVRSSAFFSAPVPYPISPASELQESDYQSAQIVQGAYTFRCSASAVPRSNS